MLDHAPEDVVRLNGVDPFCGGAFYEVVVQDRERSEGAPHVPVIEDVSELAIDFGAFVPVIAVTIREAESIVVGGTSIGEDLRVEYFLLSDGFQFFLVVQFLCCPGPFPSYSVNVHRFGTDGHKSEKSSVFFEISPELAGAACCNTMTEQVTNSGVISALDVWAGL